MASAMWSCLALVALLSAVSAQPPAGAPEGPTMTLMSGQAVDLAKFAKDKANGRCCIPVAELGDFTPIVNMDKSDGRFFAAWDKDCKNSIRASSYPSMFQFIYVCGKAGDASFDGGNFVGLSGDWCVDQANQADPLVTCSLGAPVCDAGVSGKCIPLPREATAALPSGTPQATLMSGQVVDLGRLYDDFGGVCCLPSTVLGDASPIVRMSNTGGKFFVSYDDNCGSAIPSSSYPATFRSIYVCGAADNAGCPPGGCNSAVDGGVVLLPAGSTCDPFNSWRVGFCSANNFCFNQRCGFVDSWWPWFSPVFWRPWRPTSWRPPIFVRPPFWRPGHPVHPDWGWKPGQRPDFQRPVTLPAVVPGRPGNRPGGVRPNRPENRPTLPETRPSLPETLPSLPQTRPSLPETLPSLPETRPSLPETRPSLPETRPSLPETLPSLPQTRPSLPQTRPSLPQTRPSVPQTRPSVPQTRPSVPQTRPSLPQTRPSVPQTRPSLPQTRPAMSRPQARPQLRPAGGGGGGRGPRR